MTDDEQMAGVVRPGGKRDIDEARRHARVRRRSLTRFGRRRANRWRDTQAIGRQARSVRLAPSASILAAVRRSAGTSYTCRVESAAALKITRVSS